MHARLAGAPTYIFASSMYPTWARGSPVFTKTLLVLAASCKHNAALGCLITAACLVGAAAVGPTEHLIGTVHNGESKRTARLRLACPI